jgi:glycosyltransferase involved in cell wall biosynthesis
MAERDLPASAAADATGEAPLRIMHIICSADPLSGGPIEGAQRLGEVWRSMGHVQHLVTMDPPDAPYIKECSSPVIALGAPGALRRSNFGPLNRWRGFSYSPGAVDWIRRNARDYDVAVVSGLWNYATMAARRALVGGNLPYLVFTHGMLDPWFKQHYPLKHWFKQLIWPFNEGVLMRNASAVLFTRQDECQLADGAFFPYSVKPEVIGYGTSDIEGDANAQITKFRCSVPALGNRRFLLFLSRIHPKKGCDLLVNAFADAASTCDDLDLVMAGPDQDGLRPELEALARSRGVADRVHWVGMIQDDFKWGAYHACEAFALISHSENFGIVVAEAMACGKPVLITDKVNLWREVKQSGGGLVDSDTQEGAGRLLEAFLRLNQEEYDTMAACARDCFDQHFHIANAAVKAVGVMRRAVYAANR